jgi:hypothetical protein
LDYRSRLTQLYPEVLGNESEGTDSEYGIQQKWGWFSFVHWLCEGDITRVDIVTKYPISKTLLWACYKSDMADLEKQAIQKSFNKNR